MGKYKHKDKSEGKTGCGISEDEERRKMRDSILKIFHERAQSPEGAVLVNKDIKTKALKSSKSKSLNEAKFVHQSRDKNSSIETSSSDSERDTGKWQNETRKWKRRKKVMTGQDDSMHGNKTSVTQHVKSSHTYSYGELQGRSRISGNQIQDIGGHITRKRLTRRVGLFNPGKKSKTVHRQPLPVPESVERDVEKTLKEILTKGDIRYSQSIDTDVTNSAPVTDARGRSPYHSFSASPEPSSRNLSNRKTSAYSLSQSPNIADTPTLVSSRKSSGGLIHFFPKKVPYNETASTMLSYLDTQSKETFKNRDLLMETCNELKKMMHQNQCTPDIKTTGKQAGGWASTGDSSVRRSLIHSFSSPSPAKPTKESAEVQPVIGYISISDDNTSNVEQTQPHRIPVHNHNTITSTPKESLSVNQRPSSSQTYPRSTHSRSTLQPSQPVLSSRTVQSSDRTHYAMDLSTFALPNTLKSQQTHNSLSLDFSVKPQLDLPFAATTSSGNGQKGLLTHSSLFEKPMNLFQEMEVISESRDRTKSSQRNNLTVGDDCDILWKVTDRSQSLMQPNSDGRFLRCKEFIARVSSLCGEPSPAEENVPQITLQRHADIPSSTSAYRGDYSAVTCKGDSTAVICRRDHSAVTCRRGRSATAMRNNSINKDEGHKSFLSKVMGQSFEQSPPKQLSRHRQRQTEMLGACSGDLMNNFSLPNVSFDTLELDSKDLANPYHKTTNTSQSAKSYCHLEEDDIDRDIAFSSHHPSDLLDHLDILPQQHFHSKHQPSDEDDDVFPCDSREWHYGWNQSAGILPPLKKPSLDTPSPPQKLSPHKWY